MNAYVFPSKCCKSAPTRFFIVRTDCHTGPPVYCHVCDDRVFAALRATASMPLATRKFDFVENQPYADGGVPDPIPIRRAVQDGATDITVMLSRPLVRRNQKQEPEFLFAENCYAVPVTE